MWLLLDNREGDNNQLRALAAALGFPFELKEIVYSSLRRLPFLRRGLTTVALHSRKLIKPPWPDLVIGVGYGSVSVARYIREQTGGQAKLVHVGNPRGELPDFDLQITTPQYSRKGHNLLELPFPIGNPVKNAQPTKDELEWLKAFPRPVRLVAVGGPARNWDIDHGELARALCTIRSKRPQGSLIVAVSPRTPATTRRLLEQLVTGTAETIVESFPSFGTLLAMSGEIHVTADSVSMLSEALLSGKPVGVIPIRRSLRGMLIHWLWEKPSGRRTLPNFAKFWDLLKEGQLVGTIELPIASRTCDTVERAAGAVRALLAQEPTLGSRSR